ncbi:MAG: carbohydrate ABC transporter permease [Salinirussus sp.]
MFEAYVGGPGGVVPNRIQRRLRRVALYLTALVVSAFIVTPLYVMLVVSLQSPETLFSGGELTLVPPTVSLSNFETLLAETETVGYLLNSLVITAGVVVVSTVLAVVSGYGLARFSFRGKTAMARLVLFSYMVSPIVLAIPLYIIFFNLGLLNSYLAAILAISAIAAPFSIWLMWQYFQNIPVSYEESAWTSGASRWRTVRDVVLPLARPGYISVAIFAFSVAWNDYTMVKIILNEQSLYPITLGSSLFLDQVNIGWGEQMAVALLMSIPPFVVALFLQNYLLQGFNLGHE